MKLYHYTSIGNLALILDSEKIRFTRLDKLDDFHEVGIYKTEITKQFFVSCWTQTFEESISQWAMYGSNKCGVIVCLDVSHIQFPDTGRITEDGRHVVHNGVTMGKPVRVKYLSLPELKAKANEVEDINEAGGVSIYHEVGYIKSNHWVFQNEYRLSIMVSKHPKFIADSPTNVTSVIAPDITHCDLHLDESFKKDIQVILGPLCTESDRILVKSLLKTYKITNPLKESSLKDIILK